MIYVNPIGGLANRLRVLFAISNLCKKYNRKVTCIWKVNEELGASFDDLFELTSDFTLLNKQPKFIKSTFGKSIFKELLIRGINKFVNKIDHIYLSGDVDYINSLSENGYKNFIKHIEPYVSKGSDIYIESCSFLDELNEFPNIKPVLSIQKSIDSFCKKNFTENTFGLHIRRTDNAWSISNSPLELFYDVIQKEIDKNKDTKFYISTDDYETQCKIKEKFGDSIILREKEYGRDNKDAMRDAVIDMWLLSKTKKIYGSFYSSFSEMSALIGHIELEVIKKQ